MDELRGPNIQIVLHVKEGLGFGFLKAPFVVSGSLNGYLLETDPAVPTHAPVFDAELVWEADKRRFRNLRVQNVPIKIEVFTMGTQGKKDKIGYLLLSLLGAQPCPTNKIIEVKHAWHRLLGVKSEGKCCHPQLLLSLCVQDRISIPTPRNEHRMFHSNEAAYISAAPANPVTNRSFQNTFSEYLAASKKTVSNPELQPRLLSNEGLIEIGTGKQLFVLSFVIGSVENVDLLIPNYDPWSKDVGDCHIKYCIFTQEITTDRVAISKSSGGCVAHLNQRTSLRLRTSLAGLSGYLGECPHLVVSLSTRDTHAGVCCIDLRKIIPTDNLKEFLTSFCNTPRSLTIHERCFLMMADDKAKRKERSCYMDIEISLKYIDTDNKPVRPNPLSAQTVTQLQSVFPKDEVIDTPIGLPYKGSSLTDIEPNVCDAAYTNITSSNTNRYRNAAGDHCLPTTEIADLIKKMCESLTQNQERILSERVNIREEIRVNVKDAEVQWEPALKDPVEKQVVVENVRNERDCDLQSVPKEKESSSGNANLNQIDDKDKVKYAIPAEEREAIIKRFVDELEEWKEKQQQLYKIQLERKEQYHLEVLAKEWAKRRVELECKLSKGIEQCRTLATELGKATDDFRLRGYRNVERERKLTEAKKALEQHYTAKYQELREASVKMEQDWQHQLRLKDMRIEELETSICQLERQIEGLKNTMASREKEAETKYSGLTKDQTASLIQELRCLEEKLDNAVQSKSFFKEQWGRAVRELHLIKLNNRKQMLMQLKNDRKQLQDMGLETPLEDETAPRYASEVDLEKMKDDYYVNILVNSPNLESGYINADCGPECMEMYKELLTPKRRLNDKLSDLISRREKLIQEDNPDEEVLRQLNQEIRTMLLNCNT